MAEVDSFKALGIPTHLAMYCSYWPGSAFPPHLPIADDAVVVIGIGGHNGLPRTIDEIRDLRSLGVGFDFTLQPGFDLTTLKRLLDLAPRIVVRGDDIVGWTVLREAAAMRSLYVASRPPTPLTLENLTELRQLMTIDENALFIGGNARVEEIEATVDRWPSGAVLGRSVKNLDIWEGAHVSQLPLMENPALLRN